MREQGQRQQQQLRQKKKEIPPFDFAQGRLFGDDNKKSKGKSWGESES
jgi:hypothetical protein